MIAEDAWQHRTAERQDKGDGLGMFKLIWSDYCRYVELGDIAWGTNEAQRIKKGKAVLRFITNAQMHATVLIRMSGAAPRWLHWFFRLILIHRYASEIGYGAQIGPGFQVPHPWGLAIGELASIGKNVALAQNVTLGSDLRAAGQPTIEDDVILMAGVMVAGPVTIGKGSLIGANSVVSEDIPPGSVCGPAKLRIVKGRGLDWKRPW